MPPLPDPRTPPAGQPADMHHSGWRVTSQLTDQVILTQAGQPVTGTQVYFITGNGNEGSVFIADTHYQPKVVIPALHAQAALIDTIGALSSQPQ